MTLNEATANPRIGGSTPTERKERIHELLERARAAKRHETLLDKQGHFPDCSRWKGYNNCSCGRWGYDRFIARLGELPR